MSNRHNTKALNFHIIDLSQNWQPYYTVLWPYTGPYTIKPIYYIYCLKVALQIWTENWVQFALGLEAHAPSVTLLFYTICTILWWVETQASTEKYSQMTLCWIIASWRQIHYTMPTRSWFAWRIFKHGAFINSWIAGHILWRLHMSSLKAIACEQYCVVLVNM